MKHIQSKLRLYFAVISVISIIVIGCFSYYISVNALRNKLNRASISTLEQIKKNVDYKVEKIQTYMNLFISNQVLQKMILETEFEKMDSTLYFANRELDKIFSSFFSVEKDVTSLFILPDGPGMYFYQGYIPKWEEVLSSQWFNDIMLGKGETVWIGEIENPNIYNKEKRVFVVGRTFRDTSYKNDMKYLGIICLLLRSDVFSDIYRNTDTGPDDTILIMDKMGRIISQDTVDSDNGNMTDMLDKEIIKGDMGSVRYKMGGREIMITYVTSPLTGWKIIHYTPYSYFVREVRMIGWITLLVSVVSLLVINLISFFMAKQISQPILRLEAAMKQVCEKNFNISVPVKTKDELGSITSRFNTMVGQLKELFRKAVEEEKQKTEAQLRTLQYQINPHFLYNTLGSIRMIASLRGANEVAEMLAVLGRLLRNTLNKADMLIDVSDELNNLRDYIDIQQIRYSHRIHIKYEIKECILKYKIPNMLLQPILENAIAHGLSRKLNQENQDAHLSISGYEYEGGLFFEIEDNGVGMDHKQMEEIFSEVKYETSRIKNAVVHIGLKNINDRIRYHFGGGYGVSIKSEVGRYTLVRILLPVTLEEVECDG